MKKTISILTALILICSFVLSGCGLVHIGSDGDADLISNVNGDFEYGDIDEFLVGGATISEKIDAVVIDWPAGKVSVKNTSDDKISFSETSDKELTDDMKLRYHVDGTTLFIVYSLPKIISLKNTNKNLKLDLPETFAGNSFTVYLASADIETERIVSKNTLISSASGSIEVNVEATDRIELSSASGEIHLLQKGTVRQIEIDTASGKVSAVTGNIGELSIDTASGDVELSSDSVGKFDFETASGKVKLGIRDAFNEGEIETASGGVTLTLPEKQGFVLEYDTASGDFDSGLPLKMNNGGYVYGDGSARIEVETASGGLQIFEYK